MFEHDTALTMEQVEELLVDSDVVHAFTQNMIGADWSREAAVAHIEKHGAGLSGPFARGMGHGVAVIDDDGRAMMFATRDDTDWSKYESAEERAT